VVAAGWNKTMKSPKGDPWAERVGGR